MDRDEYTDYVIDPDPPQYLDFTVPKKTTENDAALRCLGRAG